MWIIFAVLSALTKGCGNIMNKVSSDRIDSFVLTFTTRIVGLLIGIIAYLLFNDTPNSFSNQFFAAVLVSGGLSAFAVILRFDAFKQGEVSHLIPLGNFVPVVGALFAVVLLNEVPSLLGALGIVIVTTGAYVLHVQSSHVNWYEPLQEIYKLPASRKMLLMVVLVGISINIDKIGLDYVSPYMWAIAIALAQLLLVTPKALKKLPEVTTAVRDYWLMITVTATLSMTAFIFQMLSFEAGGLVGYTIAIKRTDTCLLYTSPSPRDA